jgi:hypothetical protein
MNHEKNLPNFNTNANIIMNINNTSNNSIINSFTLKGGDLIRIIHKESNSYLSANIPFQNSPNP